MTKKKTTSAAPASEQPITHIANCHFEVGSAANEHTRDAVVALANAAEANARAIEAAATALSGSNAPVTAISIGR